MNKPQCAICGGDEPPFMRRQVYRPASIFNNITDEHGCIFLHPKCILDYKKKMEKMV